MASIDPALYAALTLHTAQDHDPELGRIAQDLHAKHPALCSIALDQRIFANNLANSKRYSKILQGTYQGIRGNCLAKKSRDTVLLMIELSESDHS
jgi:hypothetical protein